ncbi:hypothetical protein ABW19_dt0205450 [Dactylella cylindrospora]|nr:hypothetical protein ABW19_dt0205450 [Dactylella cylindrospora]
MWKQPGSDNRNQNSSDPSVPSFYEDPSNLPNPYAYVGDSEMTAGPPADYSRTRPNNPSWESPRYGPPPGFDISPTQTARVVDYNRSAPDPGPQDRSKPPSYYSQYPPRPVPVQSAQAVEYSRSPPNSHYNYQNSDLPTRPAPVQSAQAVEYERTGPSSGYGSQSLGSGSRPAPVQSAQAVDYDREGPSSGPRNRPAPIQSAQVIEYDRTGPNSNYRSQDPSNSYPRPQPPQSQQQTGLHTPINYSSFVSPAAVDYSRAKPEGGSPPQTSSFLSPAAVDYNRPGGVASLNQNAPPLPPRRSGSPPKVKQYAQYRNSVENAATYRLDLSCYL